MPPGYGGTMQGYGTDAFEDAKISGIDVGMIGTELFLRNGTITNWPTEITND